MEEAQQKPQTNWVSETNVSAAEKQTDGCPAHCEYLHVQIDYLFSIVPLQKLTLLFIHYFDVFAKTKSEEIFLTRGDSEPTSILKTRILEAAQEAGSIFLLVSLCSEI